MAFRLIPAGEFWMGSLAEAGYGAEEPRHRVVITEPFWMAETPVTQEQFAVWSQAKGIDHSNHFAGKPSHPAESLDWHQASAFCEWLNREGETGLPEGFHATLPSEAQWEYACRAGSNTEFWPGDGSSASNHAGWYSANSDKGTRPVRMKPANAFGLSDLHGNVWEWCLDLWADDGYRNCLDRSSDSWVKAGGVIPLNPRRAMRGGAWDWDAGWCRSASRIGREPLYRLVNLGFRVCLVRTLSLQRSVPSGRLGKREDRRDVEVERGLVGCGPSGERVGIRRLRPIRVLDSPEEVPGWPCHGSDVQKIILGRTGVDDSETLSMEALPDDFAQRFPNLTHLHLWNVRGLHELPALPAGLTTLDVRECRDLAMLPGLPQGLEILLVDECASLDSLAPIPKGGLPNLAVLHVKGCVSLSEKAISELLRAAPNLERFDSSDCFQLTRIGVASWPRSLDRLDLNDCPALASLPARWPPALRRLGLRGSSALTAEALPMEFPPSMDYLDLAGTAALTDLPRLLSKPRTLFLHGSGVRKPPASEHGRDAQENVAARTLAYFHDVELLGEGEVRRCKLLLLGNGAAGKTCLALRLRPGKDPVKDHPGTTHGVQFWSRSLETTIGKRRDLVDLHLWDFGGQEIYHNTHRLFLSKGTVFLVLWKPEQDGQQPQPNEVGYQDYWRRLQYWLDLIHLECPTNPRIAIVCSHHAERTPALEDRWKGQVSDEHRDLPCFFVDSKEGLGEVRELEDWIEGEVGDVVNTQGVAVPPYWEIAQRMVERWLQQFRRPGEHPASTRAIQPCGPPLGPGDGAALAHAPESAPTEMPWAGFRDALKEAIAQAVASDDTGRYARLAEALEAGTFELTDDRVDRTLDFLTHGGWVYWDRKLFERRVIIGQQWALDGIYTVLERRPDRRIFQELTRSHGQFTRRNLAEWAWDSRYSEDEQRLLLSYMKAVGVCFELVSERESLWREPVYLCLEHLPPIEDVRVPGRCAFPKRAVSCAVERDQLHEGHWHALLRDLGATFGTDAIYAADAFFCENREGQAIAITYDRSSTGLGGTITVRVDGPNAADRALQLEAKVLSHLPDTGRRGKSVGGDRPEATSRRKFNDAPGLSDGGHEAGGAGTPLRKVQVFLSYAWDPKTGTVPEGYTDPVDAIEAALEADPGITVLRDRKSIRSGEDIVRFMQRIREVDKVVLIHSDRYWTSPFCMYEFGQVVDSFTDRTDKLADVLVLVEHLRSGWGDSETLRGYVRHWDSITSLPSMLQTVTSEDKLKRSAANLLLNRVPAMAALLDRNRAWSSADASEITAWVKELIHGAR